MPAIPKTAKRILLWPFRLLLVLLMFIPFGFSDGWRVIAKGAWSYLTFKENT